MAPAVAGLTVGRQAELTELLDVEQIAELLNVAPTGMRPAVQIAGQLGAEHAAIAAYGQTAAPYAVHFVGPNAEQTVELLSVGLIAGPNAGRIVVQLNVVQTVGPPNAAQTAELQTVEPDAVEPVGFGPTAEL